MMYINSEKLRKRRLLISVLTFLCFLIQAQDKVNTDSIFKSIESIESIEDKVSSFTRYAGSNRYQPHTKKFIVRAINYATESGDGLMLANSYYSLGNFFYFRSQLDSSLIYLDKSNGYLNKKRNAVLIASILNTKAGVYKQQGDLPLATTTNIEASKILQAVDTFGMDKLKKYQLNGNLVSIKNSLANLCITTENYDTALEYYDEALKISLSSKSLSRNVPILLSNKADLLMNMNLLEEALLILKEARLLKVKNKLSESSIASTDLEIGKVLVKLTSFSEALHYINKALEAYENNNYKFGIIAALQEKGDLLNLTNQAQKAKEACNSAKKIAETTNNQEFLMNTCNCLFKAEKKLGNYKQALDNLEAYNEIKTTSFNDAQSKKVAKLISKFEIEKKDAELKVLKLESEKTAQERIIYIIITITLLSIALLIAFFLFKNFKKNKLLAQQTRLLEASIDEKNVLLKETHHRVKNSFQIVSSLLYLQSESIVDKEAKIAVKEAENRVRSMVLIHQKLYSKDELVGINTKEYICDLVIDIFESHQFESEAIPYVLNVESLVLDIETITPIGLILNELIVNTLKHAFDTVTSESNITINFKKEKENLCLEIIDNGKGFTGEVKNTSFGITLMNALSKKLNAKLSYDSEINKGTKATLLITKFKLL